MCIHRGRELINIWIENILLEEEPWVNVGQHGGALVQTWWNFGTMFLFQQETNKMRIDI